MFPLYTVTRMGISASIIEHLGDGYTHSTDIYIENPLSTNPTLDVVSLVPDIPYLYYFYKNALNKTFYLGSV